MSLNPADISEAAPHIGQAFGGRFLIKNLIGAGHFSLVLLAEDQSTGRDVAIKALRITQLHTTAELQREGALLQDLSNASNVVDLIAEGSQSTIMTFAVGGTHTFDIPWLALELADGRVVDLVADLPSLRWVDRLDIFRDCARGLHQMHLTRMVHRDLKTDNTLVFSNSHSGATTKLADLGRAAHTRSPRGFAPHIYALPRGDARFAAPEMVWALGTVDPEVMCRADLYLLGSLLYELATGHGMTPIVMDPMATIAKAQLLNPAQRERAFQAQLPHLQIQIELAYANFEGTLPPAIRQEAVELLRRLTNPDPMKRHPSLRQLGGLPRLWDLQWVLRRVDILKRRLTTTTVSSRTPWRRP